MEIITAIQIETIVKLAIAMVLGMILGLERLYAHKNAGMRTYALVTMASALFVIISEVAGASFAFDGSVDRMRMASQIIVGVGFLGGGLIIFKDDRVSNLTTAAGLWIAAAIGVAVGFGLYLEAVVASVFTLFVMAVLALIERKFKEHMASRDDSGA